METKEKLESKVDEILSKPYVLILHNDDFNSFDWVINCLMKICGHEYDQAEQCAHFVHFRGKCDVKRGSKDIITSMKEKLSEAGLSVTMEKS